MAKFTNTGTPAKTLANIKLQLKGKRLVRLEGVNARISKDIEIVTPGGVTANVRERPFDGAKGIWNLDLTASSKVGDTKLQVKFKGAIVATLVVKVVDEKEISLPIAMTPSGLLSRLFLAESLSPEKPTYSAIDTEKSMRWMRLVIDNRKAHKTPKIFYAKKGKNSMWDVFDIVQARGQFHGFEKYPALSSTIEANIKGILDVANDYSHPKQELYLKFLKAALSAASAASPIADPAKSGLYGWRTAKSKHPGGSFIKYQDLAGQTFYTLKK